MEEGNGLNAVLLTNKAVFINYEQIDEDGNEYGITPIFNKQSTLNTNFTISEQIPVNFEDIYTEDQLRLLSNPLKVGKDDDTIVVKADAHLLS